MPTGLAAVRGLTGGGKEGWRNFLGDLCVRGRLISLQSIVNVQVGRGGPAAATTFCKDNLKKIRLVHSLKYQTRACLHL